MKKNMKKMILTLFVSLFALLPVLAQNADKYEEWGPLNGKDWGCLLRTGYVLGGTTPMPLPAEIRSIGTYRPQGGFTVHFDAYKMFSHRFGLMSGVHFFMEGMFTGAEVKNYSMGIQMGEDYLEGRFTGTDETESFMAGFTVPVMATFRLSPRWNMNIGPYASFLQQLTDGGGFRKVQFTAQCIVHRRLILKNACIYHKCPYNYGAKVHIIISIQ